MISFIVFVGRLNVTPLTVSAALAAVAPDAVLGPDVPGFAGLKAALQTRVVAGRPRYGKQRLHMDTPQISFAGWREESGHAPLCQGIS